MWKHGIVCLKNIRDINCPIGGKNCCDSYNSRVKPQMKPTDERTGRTTEIPKCTKDHKKQKIENFGIRCESCANRDRKVFRCIPCMPFSWVGRRINVADTYRYAVRPNEIELEISSRVCTMIIIIIALASHIITNIIVRNDTAYVRQSKQIIANGDKTTTFDTIMRFLLRRSSS